MYVKIINGRRVFSQCLTIQTNEGIWISNPTEEQIYAAGWEIYVPTVVPPAPTTEPDMDEIISAVKKMLSSSTENLSDEEALEVAALYPTWSSKIGVSVSVGERLWYDEKLWKVIQAHTVQDNWTPDVTPSLYTEVSIDEFPEWKQPLGSEDAYHLGDKVKHNDKHWISDVDNNVWEPGIYGWSENFSSADAI